MKLLLRRVFSLTIKPLLESWYLKEKRFFRYGGLCFQIEPGVFHPGLFFSSTFLASILPSLNLKDRAFLDLGCGSGFISLLAAKHGAIVTASDISNLAVNSTEDNARRNGMAMTVVHSDLFDNLTGSFDFIFINPPFFPKNPKKKSDHAWYCGEGHEYFIKLFSHIYRHASNSSVFMILSDQCNLQVIFTILRMNNLSATIIKERNLFIEKIIIYQIIFERPTEHVSTQHSEKEPDTSRSEQLNINRSAEEVQLLFNK